MIAAPVPVFHQALEQARVDVLDACAAQLKSRSAREIAEAARQARGVEAHEASLWLRLRDDIGPRARKQRQANPPADPSLPADVRKAIDDLQVLQKELPPLAQKVRGLIEAARPDAEAAAAAQQLIDDAWDLRYGALLVKVAGGLAAYDLRAVGLPNEASSLERLGDDNDAVAADIYVAARDLRAKTETPSARSRTR